MTNMSYALSMALVMLLWITNLSCTGYTVLRSDTIPKWNVQLLLGIQSHLFPFHQNVHQENPNLT